MDITDFLLDALSTGDRRVEALVELRKLAKKDLSIYLYSLVAELCNDMKPEESRMEAGRRILLILPANIFDENSKKIVTNNDRVIVRVWGRIPEARRREIKNLLIRTLTSYVGNNLMGMETAATYVPDIIGCLASMEIPQGWWPDLGDVLIDMIKEDWSALRLCLETIDCICTELFPNNGRLPDAVISFINFLETENTKFAALTVGLRRAVTRLIKHGVKYRNFKVGGRWPCVMNIIWKSTVAKEIPLRKDAFAVVYQLASKMGKSRKTCKVLVRCTQTIYEHIAEGAKDECALIETCTYMQDLCDYLKDIQPDDGQLFRSIIFTDFVERALSGLRTALYDDETWKQRSLKCSSLISAISKVEGEFVLELVRPLLLADTSMFDSRQRESRVLILGSILEFPKSSELFPVASGAMPSVLMALEDESSGWKDMTARTFARTLELLQKPNRANFVINPGDIRRAVRILLKAFEDSLYESKELGSALYQLITTSNFLLELDLRNMIYCLLEAPTSNVSAHQALCEVVKLNIHKDDVVFKETNRLVATVVQKMIEKCNDELPVIHRTLQCIAVVVGTSGYYRSESQTYREHYNQLIIPVLRKFGNLETTDGQMAEHQMGVRKSIINIYRMFLDQDSQINRDQDSKSNMECTDVLILLQLIELTAKDIASSPESTMEALMALDSITSISFEVIEKSLLMEKYKSWICSFLGELTGSLSLEVKKRFEDLLQENTINSEGLPPTN